jgi:iron complex transport system permease protein
VVTKLPIGQPPRDMALEAYRKRAAARVGTSATILAALVLSFTIDVATGPALLPLADVVEALMGRGNDSVDAIVWVIRLPIATMAVAVGWALGLSGAVMQTILNNPLASCYTLGISAAAGFGAALAILLGAELAEYVAVPINAFVFAAIACAAVYFIGRSAGMSSETMGLAGIAVLFLSRHCSRCSSTWRRRRFSRRWSSGSSAAS